MPSILDRVACLANPQNARSSGVKVKSWAWRKSRVQKEHTYQWLERYQASCGPFQGKKGQIECILLDNRAGVSKYLGLRLVLVQRGAPKLQVAVHIWLESILNETSKVRLSLKAFAACLMSL